MRTKNYIISWVSIFIILLFILGNFPIVIGDDEEAKPFTDNNHVTPAIWGYSNILNKPGKALVLTLEQKQWQVLVAACSVHAFISRSSVIPLFFDDGSEDVTIDVPHDTLQVTTLGSDAATATAKLATEYWSKAELVFAIEKYEEALWVIPAASFLEAPILVSPTEETLNSLGTKFVIAVGITQIPGENILKLPTKESVWSFQLELFDTKGKICNYVILTNPFDTEDNLNQNITLPYLSLAAAPLAAYRNAIVQTGDYTADKNKLDDINKATKRIDDVYQSIKPYFEKVKTDSYTIEKYLIDHGHQPEFLAIVGGQFAVPDYYYDIHTRYKYWSQEIHYVPSAGPYANLTLIIPTNSSVKEDLGIGRIISHSILDATNQLMRTFLYRDFLPNGKYSDLVPSNWQNTAIVADGHRQNQPRKGGPPGYSPDKMYPPSEDILTAYENNGYDSNYIYPRNESDPYDTKPTVNAILDRTQNASNIQFVAHGGSMGNPRMMWMEVGNDPDTGEEKKYFILANDIMSRKFSPSVIYAIACHTGHTFIDINPYEILPLAYIHSGAIAYIAPVTCQSICFWENAPQGIAAIQAIYFWQKLLSKNIPVGKALAEAKWDAYQEWFAQYSHDQRIEPDGPTFHLFGDPAFEPYKPNKPFSTIKDADVNIKITEAKTGKEFTVEVIIKDLESSAAISDATIKIIFEGTEKTGTTATFTAPKDAGDYNVKVVISKSGYSTVNSKSWVQVEKGEEDGDDDGGFIPGFEAILLTLAFILLVTFKRLFFENKLRK